MDRKVKNLPSLREFISYDSNGRVNAHRIDREPVQLVYQGGSESLHPGKVKGSKEKFNRAIKDGDIYLTPWKRRKVTVSEPSLDHQYTITGYSASHKKDGFWKYRNSVSYEIPYDADRLIRDAIEKVEDKLDDEKSLVTKAIGRANDRTYDLLSELAEMPETVKMFLELVKALRHPLRSLRNAGKALSVVKKVGRGRNRKRLYFYKGVWVDKGKILADIWLTYRYGIMPLYYSAQDIAEALRKKADLFTFEKVKMRSVGHVSYSNVVGAYTGSHGSASADIVADFEVTATRRCDVTTKYNKDELRKKQVALNPVKTAWEVTRLSFVIDWFVQVGSFIDAMTPTCFSARGVTLSNSYNVKIHLREGSHKEPEPGGYVTQVLVWKFNHEIEASLYDRQVISDRVSDFITVPTGVLMNHKRYLDALALAIGYLKQSSRSRELSHLNKHLRKGIK